MPLPFALQQRLLNRGVLKNKNKDGQSNASPVKKRPNEEVEEVFAESYDEPEKSGNSAEEEEENDDLKSNSKSSVNHALDNEVYISKFKRFEPHPLLEKRRIRMLKIYPLPEKWVEVPDLESNRYYYWNVSTNKVCWMSPSHPNAKIVSAASTPPTKSNYLNRITANSNANEMLNEFVDNLDVMVNPSSNSRPTIHSNTKQQKNNQKKAKTSSTTKKDFDPMDPSAYSDCPRGKWGDGLEGKQ